MIINKSYDELKDFFNNLNKDVSHFKNSNDICTPMECVEDMVDKIPDYFWGKSEIKILDPCAGNGNFFGYILQKFSNKEMAIKKNLFFNEINEERVKNLYKIFGEEINLTTKDFLKFEDKEDFDLIVANPPFAKFFIDEEGKEKRAAKNHNVSRDFILKSLYLLKDEGFLLYIIPDNWMSFADRNDVVKQLSVFQFVYLNIHGAKKYFPKIGSSFTYFLLQKKQNKENFFVENNYKLKNIAECYLNTGSSFIPLYYDANVKSILEKTLLKEDIEKYQILTSSNLHKYTKKKLLSIEKNDDFKYEIIHTPKQIIWSKKPHKFQNGWKVFISLTDKYGVFSKENCGTTQSIAFIICQNREEAIFIENSLKHPLYVFLNNICRYGNFNNIRVLQKFPKNRTEDIFEEFDISKEEKDLILKFI